MICPKCGTSFCVCQKECPECKRKIESVPEAVRQTIADIQQRLFGNTTKEKQT